MKVEHIYYKSTKAEETQWTVLKVRVATNFFNRLKGLLASKKLDNMEGMLLQNCSSIHTFGMHYSLDIVFLDKQGKVLKCEEYIKPFRIAIGRGATYTLELVHGMIKQLGIAKNDQFYWDGMEQ
jgi:uncharacterized membrane protein (UPF0127 family)